MDGIIIKFFFLAVITLALVALVIAFVYKGARWIYDTWLSDERKSKNEMEALLNELRERKKNGEF